MGFSNTIINWYHINARILPWRKNNDPYLIWVSEIILQQTRVKQGLSYYLRFIEAYPTVEYLSEASEDQVLKLWQGLGYYSRARNMMKAAKQIIEIYDGVFPNNYDEIIKLKGVGPYTAAAIASFSYKLPYAVVDGNVFRVLARYYGINIPINSHQGKKVFSKLAQDVLNIHDPATHNQAIMEFGALHCKPANPKCSSCPLASSCLALEKKLVQKLPVKEKKIKVLPVYLHFFYISFQGQIFIQKRDYSGIWKGLYQLPLIETREEKNVNDVLSLKEMASIFGGNQFQLVNIYESVHKLTHRILHIRFYHMKLEKLAENPYLLIEKEKLSEYAFPQPIEKYLKSLITETNE